MPKPSAAAAPPRQSSLPSDHETSHDDNPPSPKTAALLRRRKNADAQAAFRARRANYIANLEETVTSLEGAVRKLQDACRDARDEANELREENRRLMAIIENANLAAGSLAPPPPPVHPSSYPSPLQSSPHQFVQQQSQSFPPSASPNATRTFHQHGVDPTSELPPAFFSTHRLSSDLEGDSPWLTKRSAYSSMNLVSNSDVSFLNAGPSARHNRQLSLDPPPSSQFDFVPRDGDSPSMSSPMPPAMFSAPHDPSLSDTLSDHSRSLSPSIGEPSPLIPHTNSLHLPFNNLSIFGAQMQSPGFVESTAAQQLPPSSASWDSAAAYYLATSGHPTGSSGETETTELGRSDTVKASHYASGSAIRPSTSPNTQPSVSYANDMPGSNDMYIDAESSGGSGAQPPYDFMHYQGHHSRPSSSSSSVFSFTGNDMDMGPPASSSTLPPHLLHQGLARARSSKSARRHSFPVSDAADSYSEGDYHDNDSMYGGSGALSDAAAAGHDEGVPHSGDMSSTLAVIKAQAFGTVRKSRMNRAKRPPGTGEPGSAAKVALDALQARGLGLGLDVDLEAVNGGHGGSGVGEPSKRRKRE